MGRWGAGNFDDDLARDYLADIVARFEQFIERILAGDMPEEARGMNLLDAGECYLLPTIEIICVLHETLGCDYLPEPGAVARWAEEYPSRAEPLMEKLDPAMYHVYYVSKRRPVVQATFERMLRLSRALHEGNEQTAY